MDPLERLLAIEEIKQLKARYFRCIDTKDWDGLADVFAPEALLDHREAEMKETVSGARAIAQMVAAAVGDVVTVHHGHTPEIEILSPVTARGVWAMEDLLWWPEGAPLAHAHGFGHYHEEYRRIGGAWKISLNRLTRLRWLLEKR